MSRAEGVPQRPETQHLLDCIFGAWRTQAIHAAIDLGVVEHLQATATTASDLAEKLSLNAESTVRLLNALCALGICHCPESGLFQLTPTGRLLTHVGIDGISMRALTLWWSGPMWQLWPGLPYSVRSGKSYREVLTGDANYGHLERSSESAVMFHESMRALTALVAPSVAKLAIWKQVRSFVDVGGGSGELALTLLREYPHLSATVVDLPHAQGAALQHIASCGLTSRCQFVEGSFFDQLPHGADVYLLKSILHNWDDLRASLILRACRSAARLVTRLILVERILPEVAQIQRNDEAVVRADLNMLTGLGGRERTLKDYRNIIKSCGFRYLDIYPTDFEFSVIEATVDASLGMVEQST